MKLFEITYLDDCEFGSYLTVGTSKEDVEERETEKLMKELSCFMYCTADEINNVDGYTILLNEGR